MVEAASDAAAELWNSGSHVASSLLFYPEARAALAAARRGGRISSSGFDDALVALEEIRSELMLIGIDEKLATWAGGLADALGLRGYDSVHLASALSLGTRTTAMVSWDTDLLAAAERMDLAVNDVR